jgi:uncharacterized membrane protein
MTALSAPFAIALCAVAIDEGSLFTERRSAQALTDIAAITAAANLDKADAAVLLTLKDNGIPSAEIDRSGSANLGADKTVVSVTPGRYSAASALGSRFEAGTMPFNAVQVSMRKIGTLYFGGSIMAPPVIGTTAIASTSAEAAFSIGSGLVDIDTERSVILNAVLSGLLGTNLSLKAVDYQALSQADINVLSFTDALATRLNMTGVTYDEVLASQVTVGEIARAMADAPGLDGTDKAVIQAIAGKVTATRTISLKQLLDLGAIGRLGVGQNPGGLSVDVSALAMLSAAAALANGDHQADLDLGLTLPGLLSSKLSVAIGEREQHSPWLTVGEKDALVRTAQIRLKLIVSLGLSNGTSAPLGVKLLSVQFPLHVEVAHAEARLTDIRCPTGRPESLTVSIDAQPAVASLHLAENDATGFADFTKPLTFHDATLANVSLKAALINLDLLAIKGSSSVAIANTAPTTLSFNDREIEKKAYKTVSTHDITQSLTTSLLDNLSVAVDAAGVGANATALLGAPKALVLPTLTAATPSIDTLLATVLTALGVELGKADIRVTGATCGHSVLVQ